VRRAAFSRRQCTVFAHLAWKALTHVLDQLIFDGLLVLRDLKGAADEHKVLLQGNYTRQHQLQQLAEALERFAQRVADTPGPSRQTCMRWALAWAGSAPGSKASAISG